MNINGLSSVPLGWITPWMKSWTMLDEYMVYVIFKIVSMADDVCGRGLILKHWILKYWQPSGCVSSINLSGLRPLFCNSINPLILFQNGWSTKERGGGPTSRVIMGWNWQGSCGNCMHALVVWIGDWIGMDLFNDDTRPSGHISRPTQVNVSQSCFHCLNNYSSLIIL